MFNGVLPNPVTLVVPVPVDVGAGVTLALSPRYAPFGSRAETTGVLSSPVLFAC